MNVPNSPARRLPAPLAAAVEEAYRTFAPYRIGRRITVCHCPVCMTEATELRLTTTPLRQIPADLLAEYTNSAHPTAALGQEADELRHFLPRYFELIAHGEAPDHLGLAVPLRRLGRSGFRDHWPSAEIATIDRFFDAWMAARVGDLSLRVWPPHGARPKTFELQARPEDTLSVLVSAGCVVPRVLAVWDAAPDPAAAVHMAEARLRIAWKKGRSVFYDAHLEGDYDPETEAIATFLSRTEVTERIEAAFLAATDEGLAQVLANAVG